MFIHEYGLWLGYPILDPSDLSVQNFIFYDNLEEIENYHFGYEDDFIVLYNGVNYGEIQFEWLEDKVDKSNVYWCNEKRFVVNRSYPFNYIYQLIEKQFGINIVNRAFVNDRVE